VKPSLDRLPSPALVIACVALFVSLGGVSYGLATGSIDSREIKNNAVNSKDVRNNTMRSKDVRNNTLRTFDIRNNEVRGFDIRNSTVRGRDVALNTLGGADISEGNLAKVPSAATADTAASATTATTAGSVATLKTIALTSLAEGGTPVTLATHGPLTLTGACVDQAGVTHAIVRVQSTEASSGATGNAVFGPGTVDVADLPDPVAGARSAQSFDVFAFAPSNKSLTGQVALVANTPANSCLFHGHVALEG
jgi:hypothetical protein